MWLVDSTLMISCDQEGNEARTCCLKVKCKPPYEKHYCRNTYKVVRNYLDLYDLGATGVWVMYEPVYP